MLTEEQQGTYRRAFIERKADYLVLDGWQLRKKWVQDDLAQLQGCGWLTHDPVASERESDEQYTALCFRPSPDFLAYLAGDRVSQP